MQWTYEQMARDSAAPTAPGRLKGLALGPTAGADPGAWGPAGLLTAAAAAALARTSASNITTTPLTLGPVRPSTTALCMLTPAGRHAIRCAS
jgi:hypothetical protein